VLTAAVILIDVLILKGALRGSRKDRLISLLWPVLFFGLVLFFLAANNA
jgi:hypothetical protein